MTINPEITKIPYSQDIEKAVLVAILSDPMLLPRISEILQPSDFYKNEHQEIYHVICDLQGAADSLTVAEKLSDRSKEYFANLVADSDRLVPSISNAIVYAETVKDKAKLRAAITLGQNIVELAYKDNANATEVLQQLEDNFANFIKQRVLDDTGESSVEAYQEFVKNLVNRVDENAEGITTGLTEVDLILHRLEGLVIVAARTSLGKAQPLDAKVLTPKGFVPMGSLVVGDEVIGSDGVACNVTGVFPQGPLDVYKVTLSDGTSTECSLDHLWFTQTMNERLRDFPGSVKSTKELLGSLKNSGGYPNHILPITGRVNYTPSEEPLKLDPYLLGVLLGDGTLGNSMVNICNPEKDIKAKVLELLPEGDTLVNPYSLHSNVVRKVYNHTQSDTKQYLEELGLLCGSLHKFIPERYLYSTPENRMRLLQGLLDTDGGMANGSSIVDYCTGSKKLAQDVCTLVRSLGGVVREGHKYLKYTYRDKTSILTYYRLYIRFFNGEIPVTSLKHTRKWRVSNRVHTRKVVSIDFVGSKECQCIKIDNSSHLYITDDFIPTHNTAFAVNLARHAVNTGPVLFFSLEQTKEQIFERLLAREAQVPLEDIRSGTYLANPSMVADIAGANKSLEKVMETFHVDDRPNVSTSYITSLGRQMLYEWGKVGLIVVDYLHLMKLPTGNKVDTLGDACKELRGLGKELGCPVIVLSQLSRGPSNERGERTNKRPGMADLRASGEIEQSADIIMFLHRESYGEAFGGVEEDIAEVIVAKNRNGRLGLVEVKWVPRYMLFSDL